MNISAKTEYACLAVLELAAHYGAPEPVRIRDIADKHHIPSRFLVQILLQLKGVGLVASTRGALGGYQLQRPPEEITLAEVMTAVEGRKTTNGRSANGTADTTNSRVLWQAWNRADSAQQEQLQGTTFADLLERMQGRPQEMYYI